MLYHLQIFPTFPVNHLYLMITLERYSLILRYQKKEGQNVITYIKPKEEVIQNPPWWMATTDINKVFDVNNDDNCD